MRRSLQAYLARDYEGANQDPELGKARGLIKILARAG
jgi:hypothetical protein